EERALLRGGDDVERIELRVAEAAVGHLRLRSRQPGRGGPSPVLLRLVTTLIATEVERVRGPERASEEAAAAFVHQVLGRELADRDELIARGHELGIALERGGSVIVVRARPRSPAQEDWRARLLALAGRSAR